MRQAKGLEGQLVKLLHLGLRQVELEGLERFPWSWSGNQWAFLKAPRGGNLSQFVQVRPTVGHARALRLKGCQFFREVFTAEGVITLIAVLVHLVTPS